MPEATQTLLPPQRTLPVVVRPVARAFCVSFYPYVVDILPTVCLLPQFFYNLVYVSHLGGVESQQSFLQSLHSAAEK